MATVTASVNAKTTSSLRQELLAEQRRLAKLWDAFKRQEDEYRSVERERDDLWSRVQELEKATSAIGDPTKVFAKLKALEQDNDRLRADLTDLGHRLEEYRGLFFEEQERLAKLYKVYEDRESKLATTQKDVAKLEKENRELSREVQRLHKGAAKLVEGEDGLTKAQQAQRKFAGEMGAIRRRAKKAKGGKGPIAKRTAAQDAKKRFERRKAT